MCIKLYVCTLYFDIKAIKTNPQLAKVPFWGNSTVKNNFLAFFRVENRELYFEWSVYFLI